VQLRTVKKRSRGDGFNLVVLAMAITVMNILLALALPAWSTFIEREREEELIFRGLQYAEAIRVFQLRQSRFPTQLRELSEVYPRSIRQLWRNPMVEDGAWLLLPATAVWLTGESGDLKRRAVMAAYRGVTALFGKAPIRALRVGTSDEAATYVKQLTGWTRAARWTSLLGADYRAALATITTPVTPFVGAGDWMCTVDDARGFAAGIPNAAPLRVVGKRHGDAVDADHFQLFTRRELRPVWHELLAGLEASAARPG